MPPNRLVGAGLSPRMRGNLRLAPRPPPRPGSIPAYAGEPSRTWAWNSVSKVYPRVCGGTLTPGGVCAVGLGLSPRMRGNPYPDCGCRLVCRSIPAYAGEPSVAGWPDCDGRVYPRVCGGTGPGGALGPGGAGLSPRMRGNRPDWPECCPAARSIPAYAGEP